ncbi:Clp protease [Aeromicrobium flavum]|uniref:Clp protease n=1 Tax=Aeromicrobium flavum TaxID=416568 RepID=A0A512HXA7_9ACTN|nr:Clp protease N-terminal domain-containing protein [Aeromicrobium flavum]GEO90081.1 Clp protease [Aeromicrobium flavum]
MFERFTKEARAAVTAAQEIARDASTRTIDTRHLLIALARDGGPARDVLVEAGTDVAALVAAATADLRSGGIDADALAGIGIDLEAVRREAERTFGPDALDRAARRRGGHIPFTSDARKSLELALREAIRLKHRTIDGRHLLLGILRADSPGRELLVRQGADVEALRAVAERPAAA